MGLIEPQDDAGAGEGAKDAAEFCTFPAPFEAAEPLAADLGASGELCLGEPPAAALVAEEHPEGADGSDEHDETPVSRNGDRIKNVAERRHCV